ncbi:MULTISPECIES: MCE family protein [unclassified Rhodococcus (in: high G+C Gram-positive bacteria)]|uniref:MCE family protein n=1 Tax=unclassified Rhodococcus (in: high G+C Gram-positive bacteria) TaxID=192944 RepID=UPI00146A949D|nr:MCE family protein [Rhodococcus sp. (in: high G+C Gram-positive bacteria)]MBF0660944.1 MCE family protein [Rhodococcus sp. (in: high G+C Gram-positive bacteria)]NME80876.1 MCE family protein [Rhodococcus sp. 105337]
MSALTGPMLRLGAFCVVGVLAAVVVGNTLDQPVVGSTREYSAEFTDVEGLTPGSDVTLAGVRVGKVARVEFAPQDDGSSRARVHFDIESGRQLTTDVTAKVNYGDMIGVRYVALRLPADTTGVVLEENATIPLEQTAPPVDLTALVNGFKPLFEAIDPARINSLAVSVVEAFQGQGGTLESLLLHIASVSADVVEQEQVFNEVIANLEQLVTVVDRRNEEVSSLISGMAVVSQALAGDEAQLAALVDRGSSAVRATAALMSGAVTPLDTAVTDLRVMTDAWIPQTDNFDEAMAGLPALAGSLNRIGDYGGWLNLYMCNFTVLSGDFETNLLGTAYSEVCR